ncbi:hypothetical protein HC341_17600 [Aquisalimonas sp. 2447]|uniref:hypothetical protein n=1 Tax=Aquisalimonas sp. 2447 TaxID=2740807 RepID=UPI0014323716|nr:hypothetical protein [Aquisalimonas sp. 2447]QIT56852.1 hypothetical protein HC341_17600 [Aquisalimonas sp. 2447]
MSLADARSSQTTLLHRIQTHLGDDVLIAEGFQGAETLSGGFSYTLTAFSETRHDSRLAVATGQTDLNS